MIQILRKDGNLLNSEYLLKQRSFENTIFKIFSFTLQTELHRKLAIFHKNFYFAYDNTKKRPFFSQGQSRKRFTSKKLLWPHIIVCFIYKQFKRFFKKGSNIASKYINYGKKQTFCKMKEVENIILLIFKKERLKRANRNFHSKIIQAAPQVIP